MTSYEESRKITEPGFPIKNRFFEKYLKPFLKQDPRDPGLSYLLDQSYHAWRLGVKAEDLENLRFVYWICSELAKHNEEEFLKLVAELDGQTHDALIRIRESERNLYEASDSGVVERILTNAVRHYKVYFESELRIWGTIPFFFVAKRLGIRTSGSDPKSFVSISAGEKFDALKRIQTILPQGDIKSLVVGFDNEVRNAGEGHDSYEITDQDTILLHMFDPKTGKPSGSISKEFTASQLESLTKQCRKTIWIIRNGFYIFLLNNPEFRKKLGSDRELKVREIQESLAEYGHARWLELKKFSFDRENKKAFIALKYDKRSVGRSVELLFGNGERYELIDIVINVKYRDQVFGVLQYLLALLRQDEIPDINVEIYSEDDKLIAEVNYESDELKKLTLPGKKAENIPTPQKGAIPDLDYEMVSTIRVPFGSQRVAVDLLKAQGIKIRE